MKRARRPEGRFELRYPRRRVMRGVLKTLSAVALRLLTDIRVEGRENLPKDGPAILAGNHFHFADPVILLHVSPRQVEFVGGFRFPNAPAIVKFLPRLWGYLPVHRGGYSRQSLELAANVLDQGGVLGIFPEGGSWAQVLRPPRGGVGFIAAETGAPIVPVAISGLHRVFHSWRPRVDITIGKPIQPMGLDGPADRADPHQRKELYAQIGEQTMQGLAELLPEHERGVYSRDEAVRRAAEKSAAYPFDREDMRGM